MEIFDTAPSLDVSEAEYVRLLGFPRGHALEGRARELADQARAWYATHGRPWIYARRVERVEIVGEAVAIEGARFRSARLARAVAQGGGESVVLVAASAGQEVADSAHEAWRDERPDDYFFLEMYGSAVVEHLVTLAGARLCAWADERAMTVLPHDSPGYTGWNVSEQPQLFALLARLSLPGPLDVMDSGMLRPKKSLLAVFPVTRRTDRLASAGDLVPCTTCAFGPCQYRRAPYAHADGGATGSLAWRADPSRPGVYVTPAKALRRWTVERLSLHAQPSGAIEASFRYDGTTCSNMGKPLAFDYRVTLGPRDQGFPIRAQSCTPAPGDDGHRAMCQYLRDGDALLSTVDSEAPLVGQPLASIIGWKRPLMGPGCYCDATARAHKWGLVLETLHYALTHDEGRSRA